MTAVYRYPARTATLTNAKLLREQIAAAGLTTFLELRRDLTDALEVVFSDALTRTQQTKLDQVVAAHDPTQLTEWQQEQVQAAAIREAERKAARTALTALDALPNNTPVPSSVLKPILKWMDRLGMLD